MRWPCKQLRCGSLLKLEGVQQPCEFCCVACRWPVGSLVAVDAFSCGIGLDAPLPWGLSGDQKQGAYSAVAEDLHGDAGVFLDSRDCHAPGDSCRV